jgi:hypothetical protein
MYYYRIFDDKEELYYFKSSFDRKRIDDFKREFESGKKVYTNCEFLEFLKKKDVETEQIQIVEVDY